MNYFYSHLIKIESITVKLEEMGLSENQKIHLSSLLDSTIHHTVLDLILSKLSPEDKEAFLYKLKENPKDKQLLEFLNTRVDNIEEEIKQTVEKLKVELHEDIQEAALKFSGGK